MSRAGESITRVDVRFPNDMYDTVQQIAVKDGARTHHISQKVEVSPTIVKLVQLGINALNGKLPDILSDNISNTSDTLSARADEVSGKVLESLKAALVIERERIDAIVSELTTKGILDPSDTRSPASNRLPDSETILSGNVPDNVSLTSTNSLSDNVPDKDCNLPDNNAMMSGKGGSLPDNLPDTHNILSDDSSNSESIPGVAPIEPIGQVGGDIPQSFSFKGFHDWLNILNSGKRSKANGDIAIAIAKEKGLGEWVMDSKSYRFTKTTGD